MALTRDILNIQKQTIQGLYGELFLLMLQNIEDQQSAAVSQLDPPARAGLESTIEDLMRVIESNMKDFREQVALVRGENPNSAGLDTEMKAFNEQLREGLTAMQT